MYASNYIGDNSIFQAKSIKEMSARYREVAHKTRLSEIDKYVVIAQVLDVRLDELFIVTDK